VIGRAGIRPEGAPPVKDGGPPVRLQISIDPHD
jgi:hypothetical protein